MLWRALVLADGAIWGPRDKFSWLRGGRHGRLLIWCFMSELLAKLGFSGTSRVENSLNCCRGLCFLLMDIFPIWTPKSVILCRFRFFYLGETLWNCREYCWNKLFWFSTFWIFKTGKFMPFRLCLAMGVNSLVLLTGKSRFSIIVNYLLVLQPPRTPNDPSSLCRWYLSLFSNICWFILWSWLLPISAIFLLFPCMGTISVWVGSLTSTERFEFPSDSSVCWDTLRVCVSSDTGAKIVSRVKRGFSPNSVLFVSCGWLSTGLSGSVSSSLSSLGGNAAADLY